MVEQTGERLERIVAFRLTPSEQRELEREAGGPSKVSSYVRGVLRGVRYARYQDVQPVEREGQLA